jgi:hypothetical protein
MATTDIARKISEIESVETSDDALTTTASAGFRELPDFMGRMKAIWGDQVFPAGTAARWVREDRDGRG